MCFLPKGTGCKKGPNQCPICVTDTVFALKMYDAYLSVFCNTSFVHWGPCGLLKSIWGVNFDTSPLSENSEKKPGHGAENLNYLHNLGGISSCCGDTHLQAKTVHKFNRYYKNLMVCCTSNMNKGNIALLTTFPWPFLFLFSFFLNPVLKHPLFQTQLAFIFCYFVLLVPFLLLVVVLKRKPFLSKPRVSTKRFFLRPLFSKLLKLVLFMVAHFAPFQV